MASPAPFEMRRGVIGDAAEIARLAGELGYPASIDDMTARLSNLLRRPDYFLIVAAANDGLLGWIAAEHRLSIESGEKIEIVGLVVDGRARRAGVGERLVASAEQWAASEGLDTVAVRSNIARRESHPFYERIGYVREKTQHAYAKKVTPRVSA